LGATGEKGATAAEGQGHKIYVYYNGCLLCYALWAKSLLMRLAGYEVVSAGSPEEAAEGVRRIVGQTGRIDVLQFESHGGPGYVAFGSPVNAESFKSGPLAGLKRNMTSDSLVVFDGCDTFRGDKGANLAKTVGAQLGCRVGGYLGYAGPQSDVDPFAGYREVKSGGTPNQGLSLAEEQRQVQSRFVHEGSTALREGANELLNGDVAAFAWNQPQRAVRTWCNALTGAAAVAGKAAASVEQAINNGVGWLRGKLGI
jgi:hypothetical protein